MMRDMKLLHQISHGAPPAEVFAVLSDQALRYASPDAMRVVYADMANTPTGDRAHATTDQVQAAGVARLEEKL